MIASIVTMISAVFMPQAIAAAGNSRESRFKIAVILGIPCMILSMLRFFTIKEVSSSRQKSQEDMKVKEGIYQLFHNKYIMLFALSLLFANISSNMAQDAPYYFQYIVGDLSMQSLSALGGLAGPFTLILFPALSKRIGLKGVMQLGLACGIIGRLLPLLDLTSIPILVIGSVFCGISLMPIFILASNAVINCMDYGEWKYGKRGEGIYSCVIGFCSKVGTGLAAGADTVMTAYMDLNNVPATVHEFLMKQVLRREWGFDGFVVTDAFTIGSLVVQGCARDGRDGACRALKAQVDMDMGSFSYVRYLPQLLSEGKVSEAEIDRAVRPILAAKFKLGLFEHPYVDEEEEKMQQPIPGTGKLRAGRQDARLCC